VDATAPGGAHPPGPTIVLATRGLDEPTTDPAETAAAALQPDRRVDVAAEAAPPGLVSGVARFRVELDNGGVIWTVEDPTVNTPILALSASSSIAFADRQVVEPLHVTVYSNYAGLMERAELLIYRGSDNDLVHPLARLEFTPAALARIQWSLPPGAVAGMDVGDELQLVVRAYGAEGTDESWPRVVQLVTPEERERGLRALADSGRSEPHSSARELELAGLTADSYGVGSQLRMQTIRLRGSRVRVVGEQIPTGTTLSINDDSIPVSRDGRFAAEYLLPVGTHVLNLRLRDSAGNETEEQLGVEVRGRYLFLAAMADATFSDNQLDGAADALSPGDRLDDHLTEGRVAFYLKAKTRGRYLITAHGDTDERRVGDLLKGLVEPTPQDIFRRLDPDAYYPVYGDDSTSWRDVDTQGRLYVRADWDDNQAVWGNFKTGLNGTEYTQYVRSLYGAALTLQSEATTRFGERRSQLQAFAAQGGTAVGHSELLGTGGSLYYLKHGDILQGSEQVVVEIRDRSTGRVEARIPLVRGSDYELDELQGRLILTRPLAQITLDNRPTLTRDGPQSGFYNLLLADYEYVASGNVSDDGQQGLRGQHWINDNVALGGTWIQENREGDDYRVIGTNGRLQLARGTYLSAEVAKTETSFASIYYSDNGGLSFGRRNPVAATQGYAHSIDVTSDLRELGWLEQPGRINAWRRSLDAGLSIGRHDTGVTTTEQGVDYMMEFGSGYRFNGRWSEAERGTEGLDQVQVQLHSAIGDRGALTTELRRVSEYRGTDAGTGTLAAVRYGHRVNAALELYGITQATVDDDDGRYADNNSNALGARYLFSNRASFGTEISKGDRGDSASFDGEYRVGNQRSIYAGYAYSTDSLRNDPLLGDAAPGGLSLGQRWQMNGKTRMFNESQWLQHGRETGLVHTVGLDFYPSRGWNLGWTVQDGDLDAVAGSVSRRAYSLRGGHASERTTWGTTLERRDDSGAESRQQWLTTNRVLHRLNSDWRVAARINVADTDERMLEESNARFVEASTGFAWRPVDSGRIGVIGKYTYSFERNTQEQINAYSAFDQRSQVVALEGTYRFSPDWEAAIKLAERHGEARAGRDSGEWFDNRAFLAAMQTRHRINRSWHGLAEVRHLDARNGGTRSGWLLGLDRDINENFRLGIGYNFTDFSDDLTRMGYRYQGWYLNAVGFY
jgi:hypothetical protein